jgi:hypothetical protein
MKSGLYLFLLCFLTMACNRKDAGDETALRQELPAYNLNDWVKADLTCEEIRNADEGDPLAVVYLNLLETQYLLDTVYTCSVIAPQMYTSYDIPRHALSACGGWWAGRGQFFYTLQQGDSIAVMQARPIQGDTLGFQYTLLKQVPTTSSLPE